MSKPKGAVNRATLTKLRALYRETWSREWPFRDDYLVELWDETRVIYINDKGNPRVPPDEMRKHCAELMRECDEFTAAA